MKKIILTLTLIITTLTMIGCKKEKIETNNDSNKHVLTYIRDSINTPGQLNDDIILKYTNPEYDSINFVYPYVYLLGYKEENGYGGWSYMTDYYGTVYSDFPDKLQQPTQSKYTFTVESGTTIKLVSQSPQDGVIGNSSVVWNGYKLYLDGNLIDSKGGYIETFIYEIIVP